MTKKRYIRLLLSQGVCRDDAHTAAMLVYRSGMSYAAANVIPTKELLPIIMRYNRLSRNYVQDRIIYAETFGIRNLPAFAFAAGELNGAFQRELDNLMFEMLIRAFADTGTSTCDAAKAVSTFAADMFRQVEVWA